LYHVCKQGKIIDMSVKFEYILSDERQTSLNKICLEFRRTRKEKALRIIISVVLFLMAIMFFVMSRIQLLSLWVGLFFIFLIFLIYFGHRIEFWFSRRRFQKSIFRNEKITNILSEEGFTELTGKSEVKYKWEIFDKAIETSDYFMLNSQNVKIIIPKAHLIEGTIEEAEAIIKRHIQLNSQRCSKLF